MLVIRPTPKIITFDCYGTLVQWHRAMQDVARSLLSAHGMAVSQARAAALADAIRAAAVRFQQCEPFLPYEAILRSSLADALTVLGKVATEQDHRTLYGALAQIAPHPDTSAALTRLRTRYQLAIISNTDDTLIAGTVSALGTPIDFVVTAQQAKAYKPDHRLFEYAYAKMDVMKDETIHVGMGQFTDLKVCNELGIRSVWINREGEPLDPQWSPGTILPDLSSLPDLLAC